MLDALVRFDTWLFLQLNAGAANGLCDWLMPIVTELRYYRPFLIAGLLALAVFGGGKGRLTVLLLIILAVLTDQLSSHLLKQWVGRVRPCHVVEGARVLYRCGNTLSFPSGHATNSMAAAILLGWTYRRWLWPCLAVSVLISYSRVYLGVHYPLDMIGGWVLGGGMAFGTVCLSRRHLQMRLERFRIFRTITPQPRLPAQV